MRELLAELTTALGQGRPCVYCALVETRGSTPQKAGAAMLVYPDGGQCGTLGGGCVEAEVRQRALRGLTAGATGAGIKIGVIDSGVFAGHEDLQSVAITGEPDYGANDERTWYRDMLSHGTHVVGTIAATQTVVKQRCRRHIRKTTYGPKGRQAQFQSQRCQLSQI